MFNMKKKYETLQKELEKAIPLFFKRFLESHPNETIYTFTLNLPNEMNCIIPTGNSIEAYKESCAYYKEKYNYDEKKLQQLKWSVADWKYYLTETREEFDLAETILYEMIEQHESQNFKNDYEATKKWNKLYYKITDVFINALKNVDSTGVFSKDRNNITLLYYPDDTSDSELLNYCKCLNPKEVYDKMFLEIGLEKSPSLTSLGSRYVGSSKEIKISKDNNMFACNTGYEIFAWSLTDLKQVLLTKRVDFFKYYGSIAISSNGEFIFAVFKFSNTNEIGIDVFSTKKKKFLKTIYIGATEIITIEISKDDKYLIIGNRNGEIVLYNLETKNIEKKQKISGDWVRNLDLSIDGKFLVSVSSKISVFNFTDLTEIFTINHLAENVRISKDNKLLAVCYGYFQKNNNLLEIYDIDNKNKVWEHFFEGQIYNIDFSPDSKNLVVGKDSESNKTTVELIELSSKKIVSKAIIDITINDLKFLPNGKQVLISGNVLGAPIQIWNIEV